jgi:hypothetical protein
MSALEQWVLGILMAAVIKSNCLPISYLNQTDRLLIEPTINPCNRKVSYSRAISNLGPTMWSMASLGIVFALKWSRRQFADCQRFHL